MVAKYYQDGDDYYLEDKTDGDLFIVTTDGSQPTGSAGIPDSVPSSAEQIKVYDLPPQVKKEFDNAIRHQR